jgi:microcystin-dependent protein
MMSNILVESPFQYLTDRNGRALANGKVYIGQPNQDPQSFPKPAFFDVAGLIPAPQPIRTNSAGFPCDLSGNPQRIFTDGDYSIRVADQNDSQVTYTQSAAQGFFGLTASELANNTDPNKGSGLVGFVYQTGAAGQNVHQRLARGWVDVKDFGAVGDNLANEKAAFDAAASTGRTVLLPAGTYNVPSGDYSATRFYSYDGATTNNGTIAIVDPLASSIPVGIEATFSCSESALPFGWLAENGQVVNRLVYPQLWGFAEGSGNLVDELDKTTNPGAFGRGDGVSTFSLPDKRGSVQGFADSGAGVDAAFLLGKRILEQSATGTDTGIKALISTPAIRAFSRAVNGGDTDVAALQVQVNAIQTTLTQRLTKRATIATTSGTLHDVLSVPTWAKVINIYVAGVSTNGTSNPIIQLGTAGGIDAAGYTGSVWQSNTTNVANTTGFLLNGVTAAAQNITVIGSLFNISGNTWVFSFPGSYSPPTALTGGGTKTLGAALDRIRLTTAGGIDTFDAGFFCVTYEGVAEV